jgi:hypothetical protein
MTKWDSSRPVPWRRLMREWVIYAAIMSAVFLVFFPRNNAIGAVVGVLISGPLYLAFGFVMAKFGYTRKRLKDLRAEAKEQGDARTSPPAVAGDFDTTGSATPRPRPAPTSRTAGSARPSSSSKRRR